MLLLSSSATTRRREQRVAYSTILFWHQLLCLRANGDEVGELGWNARFAAANGVPVVLVTGDDKTAAEAHAELGHIETVTGKEGLDRFTANCRSPTETTEEIRAAAARAVERADDSDIEPSLITGEVTTGADWFATNHAHRAANMPGVERTNNRSARVTTGTYTDAFDASAAMLRAGDAGRNEFYG